MKPSTIPIHPDTFHMQLANSNLLLKDTPYPDAVDYSNILNKDHNILHIDSHFNHQHYQQQIVLKKETLQLYCSCGETSNECWHREAFISHIIKEYGSNYFAQFYQFPFSKPELYLKYFDLFFNEMRMDLYPKPQYGVIYHHDVEPVSVRPLIYSAPAPSALNQEYFYGYVILHQPKQHSYPILMPYRANWNKDKTNIKGPIQFVELPSADFQLSNEQRILNSYCEEFTRMRLCESDPRVQQDSTALTALKLKNHHTAFNLWQQMISLLKSEPFLLGHTLNKPISYSYKPKRYTVHPVKIATDKARFVLYLKQKRGHQLLSFKVFIKNKAYEVDSVYPLVSPTFFTIKAKPNEHYAFTSIAVAAIIAQMWYNHSKITILNEDVEVFRKDVLEEWTEHISLKPSNLNF